jgi:hypothetical protein
MSDFHAINSPCGLSLIDPFDSALSFLEAHR